MRLPIILFLFFIMVSCSNHKVKNDLDSQLKGKVRSLRESCYDIIAVNPIQKGLLQTVKTYNFDKKGNLIEYYSGFYKEKECEEYIYKYVDNDRILCKMVRDSKGQFIDSFINRYNADNEIVEELNYNNDGSLYTRTIYEYDNNRNDTSMKIFRAGTLSNVTISKYDDNNRKIEEVVSKNKSRNSYRVLKSYDHHDEVIEEREYDANGNLTEKHNYKYESFDKEGNPLIRYCFHNDTPGTIIEMEIEYY